MPFKGKALSGPPKFEDEAPPWTALKLNLSKSIVSQNCLRVERQELPVFEGPDCREERRGRLPSAAGGSGFADPEFTGSGRAPGLGCPQQRGLDAHRLAGAAAIAAKAEEFGRPAAGRRRKGADALDQA